MLWIKTPKIKIPNSWIIGSSLSATSWPVFAFLFPRLQFSKLSSKLRPHWASHDWRGAAAESGATKLMENDDSAALPVNKTILGTFLKNAD